ncbi:MAG: MarR family transcriptional regulator [Solirubrobacterales bacterium]
MAATGATGGTGKGDGSAREAWGLLSRLVYSGPPPFVEIAREFDLRPPSFGMLRALEQPRSMSEVAGLLRCDNSNVTGLADALEAKGLVERRPDPGDRRVKLIALTSRGRRLRARMMEAAAEPPDWLLALSERDRRRLIETLGRAVRDQQFR